MRKETFNFIDKKWKWAFLLLGIYATVLAPFLWVFHHICFIKNVEDHWFGEDFFKRCYWIGIFFTVIFSLLIIIAFIT